MPSPFGWPGARARYAAGILATPGVQHLWGFENDWDPYVGGSLVFWDLSTVFTDEADSADGFMVADPGGELVGPALLIACNASQGSAYNLHGNDSPSNPDHAEYLEFPTAPNWAAGSVECWLTGSDGFHAPAEANPRWFAGDTDATGLPKSHAIGRRLLGSAHGFGASIVARVLQDDLSVVTVEALQILGAYTGPGYVGANQNHCVLTWEDGGDLALYVNGSLMGTAPLGTTWKSADRYRAGDPVTKPRGYVDELALYDVALDAATIAAHHTLGNNCTVPAGRARLWEVV
jgi:hypothetical protein